MKQLAISDVTMTRQGQGACLSFREKIELAKLLDGLGVTVIELEGMEAARTDALRIKSIAAVVKQSVLAVPVDLEGTNLNQVWSALEGAKKPRLQVRAAVSSVQMEYLYHKKAEAMAQTIQHTVAACKALCEDVELIADDATRADPAFLASVLEGAVAAGATTVTVCDAAGNMLSQEFAAFLAGLPKLDATVGVYCANTLAMADACVIAAAQAGAGELKVASYGCDTANLANVARILHGRSDTLGAGTVQVSQLSRVMARIEGMYQSDGRKSAMMGSSVPADNDLYLTRHDPMDAVLQAVEQLGYDLSDEDKPKVFDAFQAIAAKKEKVSIRELEAIVAAAAMQVPPTYRLETYMISAGNTISSSAHMRLLKDSAVLEGVCLGDGPIDAAFLAIERITGRHYELDDFQIQAVTEGREAMGQTIVRLRSEGKLYSGRGISTDIVCASIHAYLNALNKIVYEEEEV